MRAKNRQTLTNEGEEHCLRALVEATTVDPEHDGFVLVETGGGCGEDVESETVLRHLLWSNTGIGRLNTSKPILAGLQYSRPGSERRGEVDDHINIVSRYSHLTGAGGWNLSFPTGGSA